MEVDFAISVITLFVVFNEAFQKALVDKSVCVINIAHLIVLPATKNPLFDVYFNRITALLAVIFFPVMRAYLSPFRTLCIEIFACYAGISDFLCTPGIDICIFRVRINILDISLFGFRRSYFVNFFPFYKTKKIEIIFAKFFQKTRIKNISKDSFETLFRVAVKYELPKACFSTGISLK